MRWRKLGRIFVPDGDSEWMATHATMPTPEHIGNEHYRLHFSSRDRHNRSSAAWVEISMRDPFRIERIADAPLLARGALGTFDDSGVLPSSVVAAGDARYLYYTGYHLGVTVPFRNAVGLARSASGDGDFERLSSGPILPIDKIDPYLTITPFVLHERGRWRMWYSSGTGWEPGPVRPQHRYHIRYAESDDGVAWRRDGTPCIDYESAAEYAIARPCVVRDGDRYRMWYCHRGDSYRIGYAESADGRAWRRRDDRVGIECAAEGWDAEMIGYPYVFDHGGERYMLYNGNDYGKSGFGIAILDA